eukprot:UN00616
MNIQNKVKKKKTFKKMLIEFEQNKQKQQEQEQQQLSTTRSQPSSLLVSSPLSPLKPLDKQTKRATTKKERRQANIDRMMNELYGTPSNTTDNNNNNNKKNNKNNDNIILFKKVNNDDSDDDDNNHTTTSYTTPIKPLKVINNCNTTATDGGSNSIGSS